MWRRLQSAQAGCPFYKRFVFCKLEINNDGRTKNLASSRLCVKSLQTMTTNTSSATLARRLGAFDATMIVMGGIVGAGIFMNPYVVARLVHTPFLILLVWVIGGLVALAGSFIYSELASRLPNVGGQYAYLRDGIHPLPAFLYGWALLLVIQSGGMAAVALTFGRYFLELFPAQIADWIIAVIALGLLTGINCIGVRAGSNMQSLLMILKIGGILTLIFCGLIFGKKGSGSFSETPVLSDGFLTTFGAAMVPVLFAYGGWQTSGFVAGEMKNPKKHLPLGLLLGVSGVITLYLAVNAVCLYVLGADGLAKTNAPASAVMRSALGERGAIIIAAAIAISTLGFLSQGMLTAPRVYFAMAEDKLFFRKVATVHPRTRVPVLAILLQGFVAIVIALSGKYEQILNYVISVDFIFFGLTGFALLLIRRRSPVKNIGFHVPGHPYTTLFFVIVSWLVVLNTLWKYPRDSFIGFVLILIGIPVYYYWKKHERS
jgi:APA family basic amino acid/polyamine antiporter